MNERSFIGDRIMSNKQQQILLAAESIIAQQGYHKLSMQKLAKQAGIAAGTIYRYFADKEALTQALREHKMRQAASQVLAGSESGTLQERCHRVWMNIAQFELERDPDRLSYDQINQLPGSNNQESVQAAREIYQPLIEMFNHGVATQQFKPLDTEILGCVFLEPAIGLARRRRQGIEFNQEQLQQAYELCWQSITK